MTVDDLEIPPPSGSLFSLFLLFNPLFIHLKQFINICFSFRKCNYHSKFPIFAIMTPSEISPESVREFLKVLFIASNGNQIISYSFYYFHSVIEFYHIESTGIL